MSRGPCFGGKFETPLLFAMAEEYSQELNRKQLKRKFILTDSEGSESESEPEETVEDRAFIDDTVVGHDEGHERQPDNDYIAPGSLASIAMCSISDPAAEADEADVVEEETHPVEAEAEVWLERPTAGPIEPNEFCYPKTRRRDDIPLIPKRPSPLQKEHLDSTYQRYNEKYPLEFESYREMYYQHMLKTYKLDEPNVLDEAGLPPECDGLSLKDAMSYLLEYYPIPFLNTAPRGFFTQAFAEDVENMRHVTHKCFSIEGCAKGTPKR